VIGLTGLVYGISRGGISGWNDSLVIGSLIVAAILLPLFVLIEHRGKAPMLDSTSSATGSSPPPPAPPSSTGSRASR